MNQDNDPAARSLVPADSLPFDWDRPLRHPDRDRWGTVITLYRREGVIFATVTWNDDSFNLTKPLGWFLRRGLTTEEGARP